MGKPGRRGQRGDRVCNTAQEPPRPTLGTAIIANTSLDDLLSYHRKKYWQKGFKWEKWLTLCILLKFAVFRHQSDTGKILLCCLYYRHTHDTCSLQFCQQQYFGWKCEREYFDSRMWKILSFLPQKHFEIMLGCIIMCSYINAPKFCCFPRPEQIQQAQDCYNTDSRLGVQSSHHCQHYSTGVKTISSKGRENCLLKFTTQDIHTVLLVIINYATQPHQTVALHQWQLLPWCISSTSETPSTQKAH